MSHDYRTLENVEDFATEQFPLRVSAIPWFCSCNWRVMIDQLDIVSGDSANVAQTGTALHHAIAAWYDAELDERFAISEMIKNRPQYPFADMDEATEFFRFYIRDPRNSAKPILREKEVTIEIPIPETFQAEPRYRKPVRITGHVDQVRWDETTEKFRLWDVKLSRYPANQLVYRYGSQAIFYALCASVELEQPVELGGLILPRNYATKANRDVVSPPGVFAEFPFSMKRSEYLIASLIHDILAVRQGHFRLTQSDICTYCVGGGYDSCTKLLERYNLQQLKLKERD